MNGDKNIQQTYQHVQILTLRDVIKKTSLSKTTIYALIKRGLLPRGEPILGSRRVGWVEYIIDNLLLTKK